MKIILVALVMLEVLLVPKARGQMTIDSAREEQYRPQVHFSALQHWINDPNGMVYYHGVYHLFFQYYPGSSSWGPMHWGHAESTDLIHWKEKPIALYPDSLGFIFSGSAVVDKNNSSGFGNNGKTPLVAIFTSHDANAEKSGSDKFQRQSLAFSIDDGETWTKFDGNPVLKNPGIRDFRDPKVMWYAPGKKWIMTLATKDKVSFYSSANLKDWQKESDFGATAGAHGGVWECPDLFPLNDHGIQRWILIANINPGAPNGGSASQYFIGQFDGNKFIPLDDKTRWLDYGPDEYAGVTWSNTGNRKIFLGWMSNWSYAGALPTLKWRNAMTIPRELKIMHVGPDLYVASEPVAELNSIQLKPIIRENLSVDKYLNLSNSIGPIHFPSRFDLVIDSLKDYSLRFSNDIGEALIIGYDQTRNQFFIDRSKSGKTDFEKDFAAVSWAPRFAKTPLGKISILIDASSVEIFADGGLTVMTAVFFPNQQFDKLDLNTKDKILIRQLSFSGLKSIWR